MQSDPLYEVVVNFQHVGFHCWPAAPDNRAYLRNDHRHLFKFVVRVRAEHHDRAIECHDLKESCEAWARLYYRKATTDSCERMAESCLLHIKRGFQPQWGRVECWEDGEVGGSCELTWSVGDGLRLEVGE